MDIDSTLLDAEDRMEKALAALEQPKPEENA